MNWLEKSRNVLREACTPWGIKASLTTQENYGAIFTRDAVMVGIAGILLKDEVIIEGLRNTLHYLKQLQGAQGQITSNFRVKDEEIVKVSYGTLSPKIDSCTWYLIGVGLMAKEGYIEKDDFYESVEKTINLLEGIEFNNKDLMYIPKGGNWADEYIYEGYILYDQLLRLWGLQLLANIYQKTAWKNKAASINKTIAEAYKEDNNAYYNSSFYPGGVFKKFDLAAHSVAGIILKDDDDFFNNALSWITTTFLDEDKLPTAFYPEIKEGDPEWDMLSKYFLFRFKNMPHHFHNGGIWWIWLGWLSVALSLWNKDEALDTLFKTASNYLDKNANQFDFDEYIAADTMQPNGTKQLAYTATGIVFLSLAKNGYDFSVLQPAENPGIFEAHVIKKEYFALSQQLTNSLKDAYMLGKDKLVIGIAGESGSGKSVTAKCLQIELEKLNISAAIIHQDGYYKLTPKENHIKRKEDINWVGVEELNMDLMQQHVDQFKAHSKSIDIPVVNYMANKFIANKTSLENKSVLIVEGVYSFFLKNLDFKIFMSRTYKETLEKRRSRTRETYDPFVEEVLEIEHAIVASQKSMANAIITKDYSLEKAAPHKKQ